MLPAVRRVLEACESPAECLKAMRAFENAPTVMDQAVGPLIGRVLNEVVTAFYGVGLQAWKPGIVAIPAAPTLATVAQMWPHMSPLGRLLIGMVAAADLAGALKSAGAPKADTLGAGIQGAAATGTHERSRPDLGGEEAPKEPRGREENRQ
jgi:hypothetical protein